jgi:group I intron endonuclease
MQEYFLYRHIRLDTNKPFYIGIGTKPKKFSSHFSEYKRAYAKKSRNSHWKNIVGKVGYKVEIIMESDNKDLVIENEKYFIALYGRKDLGTGILVNMTAGGEGTFEIAEETRNKISKGRKGRKHTEETRKKMSESRKGENHPMYGRTGERSSCYGRTGERHPMYGKTGEKNPNSIPIKGINNTTKEERIFSSIAEAGRILKIYNTSICNNLKNRSKSAGGFTFEYINN